MNEKENLNELLKAFYDAYLTSDLWLEMDEDSKFEISQGHRAIQKVLLMKGAKECTIHKKESVIPK